MPAITVKIPDFFEIGIPGGAEEREHALVNMRWVLSCWADTIGKNYDEGSPRYVEVQTKLKQIFEQLRPHLSESEWYQCRKGLVDEETGQVFDLH